MSVTSQRDAITEAVGYFSSVDDLQAAADELMSSGFDRADLSLLASREAVERRLGTGHGSVVAMEDDPAVPRAAYLASETVGEAEGALIGTPLYVLPAALAASGGTLAAVIAAAAAGGGFGLILAKLFGDRHARRIREQLDAGGLLLWVRTWDERREGRAVDIMRRHSGHDVHVHGL